MIVRKGSFKIEFLFRIKWGRALQKHWINIDCTPLHCKACRRLSLFYTFLFIFQSLLKRGEKFLAGRHKNTLKYDLVSWQFKYITVKEEQESLPSSFVLRAFTVSKKLKKTLTKLTHFTKNVVLNILRCFGHFFQISPPVSDCVRKNGKMRNYPRKNSQIKKLYPSTNPLKKQEKNLLN